MVDNLSRHRSEMIMNSNWPAFFENLVRSHQGRSVTIEQDGNLLLENPPEGGVPLQGIELRSSHRHQLLAITTGGRGAPQTYTIEAPNLVWAVHNAERELVAVEIIDATDRNFIVRFA